MRTKARASGARAGADARRAAIREILARRPVTSQDELRRELAARGIAAAQATLSRDLGLLGVARAPAPTGPRYRVATDDATMPIAPVRGLVDAVLTNGVMVVVRTKAGAASTVARAIDDARVAGALGTLAGDDTIFIAPAAGRGAPGLARELKRLLGV